LNKKTENPILLSVITDGVGHIQEHIAPKLKICVAIGGHTLTEVFDWSRLSSLLTDAIIVIISAAGGLFLSRIAKK
jgi:hypothetical protein